MGCGKKAENRLLTRAAQKCCPVFAAAYQAETVRERHDTPFSAACWTLRGVRRGRAIFSTRSWHAHPRNECECCKAPLRAHSEPGGPTPFWSSPVATLSVSSSPSPANNFAAANRSLDLDVPPARWYRHALKCTVAPASAERNARLHADGQQPAFREGTGSRRPDPLIYLTELQSGVVVRRGTADPRCFSRSKQG